jgi:hypothetical protein
MELVVRFLLGGLIVSIFAIVGDVLRPKSFAGLFGAAPSVALATLALTLLTKGRQYAALEARSMIAGVLPLRNAPLVLTAAFTVWLALAILIWRSHRFHVRRK